MRTIKSIKALPESAIFAGLLFAAGASYAADVDVYLEAKAVDKTLIVTKDNPATIDDETVTDSVPMWVYAQCLVTVDADPAPTYPWASCNSDGDAPGPRIEVDAADRLTIHVLNHLAVPVSVVIPGQSESTLASDGAVARAGVPATFDDGRLKSLTHMTPAGGESRYVWNAPRPGTYLYQSGTMPSHEVPMGLYGALIVNGNGNPYPASEQTDSATPDEVVFLSEIDKQFNIKVTLAMTSGSGISDFPPAISYDPIYLLVNGEISPALGPLSSTDDTLLRLLNAGLKSHTPTFVGIEMSLIAEDGNLYPGLPKQQSAVLLPAGKTLDAMVPASAGSAGRLALTDRSPEFANSELPYGSLIASVGGTEWLPYDLPTAQIVSLNFSVPEDTTRPLALQGGGEGTIVTPPSHGTLSTTGGGAATMYTPHKDYNGPDTLTYYWNDGDPLTADTYIVQITVDPVNDDPVASDDAFSNVLGGQSITFTAADLLSNDIDVDGDALTVDVTGMTAVGGVYTYSTAGNTTVEYTVSDGTATSDPATISFTLNQPVAGRSISVVDSLGNSIGDDFRWTVEEDRTWKADPTVPNGDSLAANFHQSYMPVVAQGIGSTAFSELRLDPSKHYFVTVLPLNAFEETGYTLSGTSIAPGQTNVRVVVNQEPTPVAQIRGIVFEDNHPTNGVIDGNEVPLGGFQITLEDAGGRYGASAGVQSQDAFGNPLRNYLPCFDGQPQPEDATVILSCPQDSDTPGEYLIRNLAPAKYGVIVTAPAGAPDKWIQTSTIEGTKVIDAWVKPGEPDYFTEFGPPGWHVITGFVSPDRVAADAVALGNTGSAMVTGKVTNAHMSRPPNQTVEDSDSYASFAHTRALIGVNIDAGVGNNIAVVQANEDGTFEIDGLPAGTHQLVVWDTYLDQVIGYRNVTVTPGTSLVDAGNIPIFNWFSRIENNVFLDDGAGNPANAGNGIRDPGEQGLPEQAVNIRWRDGTVNQSFPTDLEGFVPFDQVFPFFNWLVAEVDYARFEPTGLTVTVDGGGDSAGAPAPYTGILNPQVQNANCTPGTGCMSRTETGPVLTQGFQGFLGQTSIFDWGKRPWAPGTNGGISGIVYYAVTRAEGDPRKAAAEPWEPGIPRVKVNLYREVANPLYDPVANPDADPMVLALVDTTETDSWDDSLPTGCPGAADADLELVGDTTDPDDPTNPNDKCYDGLRNFNQARPAVFDGGYAFNDIPPGEYVVEVDVPDGYTLLKEEDVNVGFGETFDPVPIVLPGGAPGGAIPDAALVFDAANPSEPGLAQPECVGDLHEVGATLSMFPGAGEAAPYASVQRPYCDRKKVTLADQGQAAADFFLFTQTPIAAHIVGMILDDGAQEFNPRSPQFGEKWAPPFVPVAVYDYTGREILRTYSDQWGRYNLLLPSTFTTNLPAPSGMGPGMYTTCMNDPGPLSDGNIDPQYNSMYSNFCYTFQYMPGTTTYLDTPVLPTAAFASGYNYADCALPAGTPMIDAVDRPFISAGEILHIASMGPTEVPNPAYEGPLAVGAAAIKTITRDYGFGGIEGEVWLNGVQISPANVDWDDAEISVTIPNGATSGQLVVVHDNGAETQSAVTITIGATPNRTVGPGGTFATIQEAIDAASPGDTISVAAGVYNEAVIMWKPVILQGAGAGSTIINATALPTEQRNVWRDALDAHFANLEIDALPNQEASAAGFVNSELAGITVIGTDNPNPAEGIVAFAPGMARIDGFTITGADVGGGINVNSWAHGLEISNNRIAGNSGNWHGGIRIGEPFLELASGLNDFNVGVDIHDNAVVNNGGLDGAGGGISIATGSTNYNVASNLVCGNYSNGNGGGIGHLGLSDGGVIENNQILFNQTFNQQTTVGGGGVFIGGEPSAVGLSAGAGSVTVAGNTIQGNEASSGKGGGIRTQYVNGLEYDSNNPSGNYLTTITDNVIRNNVSADEGAGMSLLDTVNSDISDNTVARNDSTATIGALISGDNSSEPVVSGIATDNTSSLLVTDRGAPAVSGIGAGNDVWDNRAFYYSRDPADPLNTVVLYPVLEQRTVGECIDGAPIWNLDDDLGLNDGLQGYNGSPVQPLADNDAFYCNGGRPLAGLPGAMLALPALDEGGNDWVDVRWGPLSIAPAPVQGVAEATAVASTDGATLAGGTLDFGRVAQTAAATLTIDVTLGDVEFSLPEITGADAARFSVATAGSSCVGATIAEDSSCTIEISFDGSGGNNALRMATLTLVHSGTDSPLVVTLEGR